MGKSAASKQQVTDYLLSVHMGVSTAVDAITEILIDKKSIWTGNLTASGTLDINLPNLNGGPTQGGGPQGQIYYLDGNRNQVLPPELAQRLGVTPQTSPGFRGLASLFWVGRGGSRAFNWTSNNPYVAQNVTVKVRRAPVGLDPTTALITATVQVTTVTHREYSMLSDGTTLTTTTITQYLTGTDLNPTIYSGDTVVTANQTITSANPAHMIFETMTNATWGMGCPAGSIATGSFTYAAQVLHGEGLGLAMLWAQQSTIEDFINEILNHIQAVLYLDPTTGLWTLKLIRNDYVVGSLPVFSPDNAKLSNYQKKLHGETINEIAVSWTNPINEKTESVYVQDLANISIQGGIVSDSRNYYGVRTAALATQLAARDLRASAAPLRSMELRVNRSAWNLTPGSCFVVNWPEYRMANVVMRVGKIDYGKAGDPEIKITALEDVFSLDLPTLTPAPSTIWGSTTGAPAAADNTVVFTLPAFFCQTADFQPQTLSLTYPEVLSAALVYAYDRNTTGFDLYTPVVNASGVTSTQSVGTKTITERAVLGAALAAEASSTILDAIVADHDRGPIAGGFAFIGNTDGDFEIALVQGSSTGANGLQWTLARGVLDTVPTAWPAGTPIWFVNIGARIVDDQTIRSAGEVVDYQMVTRSMLGALPLASAPTVATTLSARPHLPLRPANVQVNGVGFGPVAVGNTTTLKITWSTRNRTLEDGQAVLWGDAPVAPEYAQATVVTVTDVASGQVVYKQGALWTENELDLPVSYFARYASVVVSVSSLMNGFASLHGYSLTVTGLPNNSSAAAPPAAPAASDPPSPAAPPLGTAWTVTAALIHALDGTTIPTITVAGTPDVASARELIVRIRQVGASAWDVRPAIRLNGLAVTTNITGITSGNYEVELAYQLTYGVTGDILSQWQYYGPITVQPSTLNAIGPAGDTATPTTLGAPGVAFTTASDATGASIITLVGTTAASADANIAGYEFGLAINGGTQSLFPTTGTSFSWQVPAGVSYSLVVRGVKYSGTRGAWSAAATGTTATDTTPPGPASNLAATAGLNSIFVTWINSSQRDVDHAIVLAGPSTTQSAATQIGTVAVAPGLPSSFSDTTAPIGTPRYYWIYVVDTSGNASTVAGPVSATALGLPAANLIGTITDDKIAGVAASKISGILATINIPGLDASKLISGQLPPAVTVPAVNINGQINSTQLQNGSVLASKLASGASGNLLGDPLFLDAGYWSLSSTACLIFGYSNPKDPLYTQLNTPQAMYFNNVGASANQQAYFASAFIPVEATKVYRCAGIFGLVQGFNGFPSIQANWFDINHNYLNNSVIVASDCRVQPASSSFMNRVDGLVTAPVNAAYVQFIPNVIWGASAPAGYAWFGVPVLQRAVDAGAIVAGSIDAVHINTTDLYAANIGASIIQTGTLNASVLAAGSITTNQIAAGAITTNRLAAGAVTTDQLAAGAVVAAKIAAGAIGTPQLAAGSVTSTQIAAGAVTASMLSIGQLGQNLLSNGGFATGDGSGWNDTGAQADGYYANSGPYSTSSSVGLKASAGSGYFSDAFRVKPTSTYLIQGWYGAATSADTSGPWPGAYVRMVSQQAKPSGRYVPINSAYQDQVTNAGIPQYWNFFSSIWTAPGTAGWASLALYNTSPNTHCLFTDLVVIEQIQAVNIANGAITASQIQAGTITGSLIAGQTITGSNILGNTITADKIQANSLTTAQIQAGGINADRLQAGTITATQISASAGITATQLSVSDLSAISANLGVIQVGYANIKTAAVGTLSIAGGSVTEFHYAISSSGGTLPVLATQGNPGGVSSGGTGTGSGAPRHGAQP